MTDLTEAEFVRQMIAHLEGRAAGGSNPRALDAAGVHRKLCFDFPQPTAAHLATLSTALRSEIDAIARGGGDKLWGDLAVSAEFLSGVEYCATASSATGVVRAGAAEIIALVVVKLPRALGDASDSAAAARFLGDSAGGAGEEEDAAFVLRCDALVARARYELFAPIPSARWGALTLSRDVVALAHARASPPLLRIASERAVDQRDDAVGVLKALLAPVDAASPLTLATLRAIATVATALDDGRRGGGRGGALPREAHALLLAALPGFAAALQTLASRQGDARAWGPLLDLVAALAMRGPRGTAQTNVAQLESEGVLRTLTSTLFASASKETSATSLRSVAEGADPSGHAAAISALLLFCALKSDALRVFLRAIPWVRSAVLTRGVPCAWKAGEAGAQQRAPVAHAALWALLLATPDEMDAAEVQVEVEAQRAPLACRIADALCVVRLDVDVDSDAAAARMRRDIASARSTLALLVRVEARPKAWPTCERGELLASALAALSASVGANLEALSATAAAATAVEGSDGAAAEGNAAAALTVPPTLPASGEDAAAHVVCGGGEGTAAMGEKASTDLRRKLLELRRMVKDVMAQSKAD